ncbi:unnamed protein product [Effrenium voratum]|nr:unnamed protein product [Effrenium voratum]
MPVQPGHGAGGLQPLCPAGGYQIRSESFGENGAPCNPQTPGGVEMKGCDYVDISLVDGWTLPVKLDVHGDCRAANDQKIEDGSCQFREPADPQQSS